MTNPPTVAEAREAVIDVWEDPRYPEGGRDAMNAAFHALIEAVRRETLAKLQNHQPPRLIRVDGPMVDGAVSAIRFMKVFTEDDIAEALGVSEAP